jgi:hypothetical protein
MVEYARLKAGVKYRSKPDRLDEIHRAEQAKRNEQS